MGCMGCVGCVGCVCGLGVTAIFGGFGGGCRYTITDKESKPFVDAIMAD